MFCYVCKYVWDINIHVFIRLLMIMMNKKQSSPATDINYVERRLCRPVTWDTPAQDILANGSVSEKHSRVKTWLIMSSYQTYSRPAVLLTLTKPRNDSNCPECLNISSLVCIALHYLSCDISLFRIQTLTRRNICLLTRGTGWRERDKLT